MTPIDLKTIEVGKEILDLVPARTATHYTVFPLGHHSGVLRLAVPHDMLRAIREELRIILGCDIDFVYAPAAEIRDGIARCYGLGASVIETLTQEKNDDETYLDIEDLDRSKDSTIITLANELFLDALKARASDIHIEPFEKALRIRYRVDGLLQEAKISGEIRKLALNLISRIKIMAKLDIGEKRVPQDGRIKIKSKEEQMDLRVSVLPSSFGEAVVIRILKPLQLLNLGELGFDEYGITAINGFLRKPHGVILLTGPTGSGKTTTLYSCLRELNNTERKIITIEDPVEYKLPGIIQMQVNSKIDFTFAKALRAILRHDPDCIMVGEIRDGETAEIAIRAALTGHLVFSTLHTNDAPSAVTRLVEMGVEPYLVASALEGVIAQRLIRKYCSTCFGRSGAVNCAQCSGAGFSGRVAISEFMSVTEEIRDLLLKNQTGSIIRKTAVQQGMRTLHEDGMVKVKSGVSSALEIERIVAS